MFEAINSMLLDMIAAIARKDYDDRRRRQKQGIAKAKANGKYKGRPENKSRNAALLKLLESGQSWNSIIAATGCSRSTLSKLRKMASA
jgi:DNA invertase Pin-like site-specific DNA recombinase